MALKPAVGDTVHFVNYGTPTCSAALITRVDPQDPDLVDLTTFPPHANPYPVNASRRRDDTEKPESGTWHFPSGAS
jgi:hypothetical protein